MKTLFYYRDCELLTNEQKDLLIKMWDVSEKTPYNFITSHTEYDAYPTGLSDVYQILMTIEHDESLQERSEKLIERISKGLTPSSSYYVDYVETNILHKLIEDAIKVHNKYTDEPIEKLSFNEIKRLYKIPTTTNSNITELNKQYEKLKNIPKRDCKKVKFKNKYNVCRDSTSTFKCYTIKGRLSGKSTSISDELRPFVAKLHEIYSEGYFQLNVYDYANSDNVVNMVLTELLDQHLVALD